MHCKKLAENPFKSGKRLKQKPIPSFLGDVEVNEAKSGKDGAGKINADRGSPLKMNNTPLKPLPNIKATTTRQGSNQQKSAGGSPLSTEKIV